MENDTIIAILYLILLWFLLLTIRIQKLENKIFRRNEKMEDDDKLKEFNNQLEQQHFRSHPINQVNPNQPPNPNFAQQQDQHLINSFNPGTPPSEIHASFGRCEQCGTFHPPLRKGERCPVAPIKNSDGEEIDLNPFFAQLKNICMSQIQQKGIKDTKKLFQYVTVEITKLLETYNG